VDEVYERHAKLLKDCFMALSSSSVLVAGLGGLGSFVAELLTRIGVGHLFLVDYKVVDEPDLNRQILYTREDLGKRKVEAAKNRLSLINPKVNIEGVFGKIEEIEFPDVDVIVDCLDTFKSRFFLEKVAWKKRLPMVHGGVLGFTGQITVLFPGKTRRLSEIFPDAQDVESPQVFPSAVALVAAQQVSETIKLICGYEDSLLLNRLLVIDTLAATFDEIIIR